MAAVYGFSRFHGNLQVQYKEKNIKKKGKKEEIYSQAPQNKACICLQVSGST